jgi:hypothetical protein
MGATPAEGTVNRAIVIGSQAKTRRIETSMTEADWLACHDPRLMLDFLSGKLSNRKLRLFGCACCGRSGFHRDTHVARAVRVAELHAEGLAEDIELVEAMADAANYLLCDTPADICLYYAAHDPACNPFYKEGCTTDQYIAFYISNELARLRAEAASTDPDNDQYRKTFEDELAAQSDLLRDIAGNPVRPMVASRDLAFEDTSVQNLARSIYDGHRFADMPQLASALQSAGCTNLTVLAHCRDQDAHVRGCWALDLLLGRT